jgi:7,8-dihydroneopterin aldolase/epimerase/oxygenase
MSDTIFVTGLIIHAHHGVMEHEAHVGQRFVLDLELAADLSDASHSDKLIDTISYSAIVEVASAAFTAQSYKLVEAAAGAVADAILAAFGRISSVRVTVHKPQAPIAAIFTDVGVTLLRTRDGDDG